MKVKKTGIYKSKSKVQPYQVWFNGSIHWFAYTKEEAELKLKELAQKEV